MIPVTTIYDKIRAHEKKYVKRNVTLLNFQKLCLLANGHIAIKVEKNYRDALQNFLQGNPNINSIYKTVFESDLLAECIFEDVSQLQNFKEELEERFHTQEIKIFTIIEEPKKEDFLTKLEHFEMLH